MTNNCKKIIFISILFIFVGLNLLTTNNTIAPLSDNIHSHHDKITESELKQSAITPINLNELQDMQSVDNTDPVNYSINLNAGQYLLYVTEINFVNIIVTIATDSLFSNIINSKPRYCSIRISL